MANRWGNSGNSERLFSWAPKSLRMVIAAMKLKDPCSLKEKLWPTLTAYKKQRCYFANKGLSSQGCGFSSGQVWMWELDYKASWALKNWCFWTVLWEKTLESPLDCKEVKPVNPKGSRSWIFIGRTDAKVETPILWLPDAKNWLIWKDLDAGKGGRQKEKEMTKDEMVAWHHWLDEHEFGDGQGSLLCCRPWVAKSQTWLSDWTEVSSPKHLLFQSSCGSRTWAWLSEVRVSGCPTKLLSGIGCCHLTTWLGKGLGLSMLRWIAQDLFCCRMLAKTIFSSLT